MSDDDIKIVNFAHLAEISAGIMRVLGGIIKDFGLDCKEKFGRGFQARVWQEALHKHLNNHVTMGE